MAIEGKELLDYACAKFQNEAYDEALEAFVLAYSKGYEQEWILENIYSCYMSGNEETFRNAYEQQTDRTEIAYEDCILDFVPYRDGEYYIFDKEIGIFRGVFSVLELEKTQMEKALQQAEYSAVALMMDWDWREQMSVLTAAKERRLYMISDDMRRSCAFFKLPELEAYMRNIMVFSDLKQFQFYFHEHTSVYLPYALFGKQEGKAAMLEVIEKEHQYRLTPEGRNTENVLLTIGIPTHDRGNLLLKRIENLCKMPYDAEIEFAISKNAMHYYQDEYKRVEAMTDARINYVGCDEELGISKSWQNVVKIAHGKFVLMVSDEDDVEWRALEHYFKLLSEHENLGYVRAATAVQRRLNEDKYYKQGKEAFVGEFMQQNYLSGAIYNKRMFEEADMAQYDLKYGENEFFRRYPHMWWHVMLSLRGDYAEDSRCLILEGDSVWKEEGEKCARDGVISDFDPAANESEIIEIISSYEARLKQFCGIVALIKDCNELDEELRKTALFSAIGKTYYLMDMVKGICGKGEEEYAEWIEKLIEEALAAMRELQIKQEDQKVILANMMMWINKNIDQYEREHESNQ